MLNLTTCIFVTIVFSTGYVIGMIHERFKDE